MKTNIQTESAQNANYIFVSENKIVSVRKQQEEDTEDYLSLLAEMSSVRGTMEEEQFREFLQYCVKQDMQDGRLNVSVFDKETGEYAGNIVLKDVLSRTPEVGIDIKENCRRKGLAENGLRLFLGMAKGAYAPEYFVVRIYNDNEASLSLFRKLGAKQIGEEPGEYSVFLQEMKENDEGLYERVLQEHPDAEEVAGRRKILVFRLG